MQYLIYVSQASSMMSESSLASILDTSRQNNRRDEITGLLIYKVSPNGKWANFMQLLEGGKAELDNLYQRLLADARHHSVILLERKDTSSRSFPDWWMGFRNIDIGDLNQFEGYSDLGSPEFWEKFKSGELLQPIGMMRQFYEDG